MYEQNKAGANSSAGTALAVPVFERKKCRQLNFNLHVCLGPVHHYLAQKLVNGVSIEGRGRANQISSCGPVKMIASFWFYMYNQV